MAKIYDNCFDEMGVERVIVKKDRTSVYGQYTIKVSCDEREIIQKKLLSKGIPTSIHYPTPLSMQKPYQKYKRFSDNFYSLKASKQVLSLPIWANIDEEKQFYIIREFEKILKN